MTEKENTLTSFTNVKIVRPVLQDNFADAFCATVFEQHGFSA